MRCNAPLCQGISPATASAEGRQFNGAPSPWERVGVRGFSSQQKAYGTLTLALSLREREQNYVRFSSYRILGSK